MKRLFSLLFLFIFFTLSALYADLATNEFREDGTESTIAGTESPSDIDTLSYQNIVDPLQRLLDGYVKDVEVRYASSSTITVTAGEIICENTAGTNKRMRENTSNLTLTWSDIDTGAEANSTKYYIFAVADADASTYTGKISASSTSPSGATYYKLIGSFYNNASGNIEPTMVSSSHLNYDTAESYWGYDTGWTSTSNNTLYTKAHGLTFIHPADIVEIIAYWRTSSAGSTIINLGLKEENDDGAYHTTIAYDATNIYFRNRNAGWGYYINSAGAYTIASGGEVRILARIIPVDF